MTPLCRDIAAILGLVLGCLALSIALYDRFKRTE